MFLGKDGVYIIAEIGGNFVNFDQAEKLIDAAKECGVNAVKLQTYRADTLTSKDARFAFETTGNVAQYELFKKYEIDASLHKRVFDYARSLGLEIFSTPSHVTDLEMLETLGCTMYKVGSDDAVNLPFLKQIAKTGKPILLATGMCTMEEVDRSINSILEEGCGKLAVLHAISLYPTHAEDVNLKAIQTLKNHYPDIPIGYSDHTFGITASICAAAMGAEIIEKHFTYDKNADGPDHIHSADIKEMKTLVSMIREFEIMCGTGVKAPAQGEVVSRINNRKSVVLVKALNKGTAIDKTCVEIKRPGSGIQPKDINYVLGRKVIRDMKKDEVLTWEDLS